MRTYTLLWFIILGWTGMSFSQNYVDKKRDFQWVVGTSPGGMMFDFSSNPFLVSPCSFPLNYASFDATSISDTCGSFLFATNGARVIGKDFSYLPHGDSLSYGWLYNLQNGTGNCIPLGNMILPMPMNDSLYYVFHEMQDWVQFHGFKQILTTQLLYSIINQRLNQGKGDIILKNQRIILDTLQTGFRATRHANGRDWWLIAPRSNTQSFYIILFSKFGIQDVKIQDIGNIGCLNPFLSTYSSIQFSPQGDQLVISGRSRLHWFSPIPSYCWIRLYDFDRCTGTLSNFRENCEYSTDSSLSVYTSAFSPDGKYVYSNDESSVYQFDVSVLDFGSTRQLIASWDGYVVPTSNTQTVFGWPELLSDNQIYYTANSTQFLHVLENPNLAWPGCQFIQRKIQLPDFTGHILPNFPNFRLGPVSGSVCDSLSMGISVMEPDKIRLNLIPNPADDYALCQISGITPLPQGILYLYEPSGHNIWQAAIHDLEVRIPLQGLSNGLYLVRYVPEKGLPVNIRLLVTHN